MCIWVERNPAACSSEIDTVWQCQWQHQGGGGGGRANPPPPQSEALPLLATPPPPVLMGLFSSPGSEWSPCHQFAPPCWRSCLLLAPPHLSKSWYHHSRDTLQPNLKRTKHIMKYYCILVDTFMILIFCSPCQKLNFQSYKENLIIYANTAIKHRNYVNFLLCCKSSWYAS